MIQLGQRSDLHFDEHEGYLIWTEQIRDKLWFNKASQDLMIYDTSKRKKYRITTNEILYNPVFSPNGEQIAVFSMPILIVRTVGIVRAFTLAVSMD